MLPEHFRLDVHPVAACDTIVRAGSARFTVLTDGLIRLEYDPAGAFRGPRQPDDVVSPAAHARLQRAAGRGAARSSRRARSPLCYVEGQDFTPENLSIHVKATGADWHPGAVDTGNLKGTTRTLDFVNGYTRLNDGLISRSGWALLDNSRSLVFNAQSWLEPRQGQGTDWYFFAYGHDYKAALRDYCAVSGKAPLIPRWILGNWWSRFWAYTQDELAPTARAISRRTTSPVRVHRGYGLARHPDRQSQHGLDGLYVESRPVPRPARSDRLHPREGPADGAEPAPGRGHSSARGAVPRDGAAHGDRPGLTAAGARSTSPIRRSSEPTLTCCTIPTRRWASISGGSTGSRARLQDRRVSTRCG